MALLMNISLLLLLACISHQLVLSSSQKSHGRRTNKDKKIHHVGHHPNSARAHTKGKLVTKDKSECTWSVSGNDLLTLRVTCQKGVSRFSCEYNARPSVCPQYSTKAELYWEQIARALKKHQSLCQESNVSIKAGLCRRAARNAHFRLSRVQKKTTPPPPTQPQPRAVKSCLDDNTKRAAEYCSNPWSSVCLFFFTMVQDYDCWGKKRRKEPSCTRVGSFIQDLLLASWCKYTQATLFLVYKHSYALIYPDRTFIICLSSEHYCH